MYLLYCGYVIVYRVVKEGKQRGRGRGRIPIVSTILRLCHCIPSSKGGKAKGKGQGKGPGSQNSHKDDEFVDSVVNGDFPLLLLPGKYIVYR